MKEPITVEEKQHNGLWSMTAMERFSFLTYMFIWRAQPTIVTA
ncbi:hypothetical protein HanHA300_Chr17g0663621 [Helianthus annuus]|nr:hypothetical protein HanHA300_Chr17g0663621 [Helianthus annuus]KAJ0448412.1 hypothetical protein HanHA89_Chr17g0716561 [Helianthus annuus]KAJ0798522.1 hypothetical protein HanLR1_Chr00c2971g0863151 [Helianthus annuus]